MAGERQSTFSPEDFLLPQAPHVQERQNFSPNDFLLPELPQRNNEVGDTHGLSSRLASISFETQQSPLLAPPQILSDPHALRKPQSSSHPTFSSLDFALPPPPSFTALDFALPPIPDARQGMGLSHPHPI